MKKFLALVAAVALVLGVGSVAYANYCATDVVPAATILYPFVQYNYTDPNNNTLFSVTNVSNEAVIVHFTLWTDYSVGVVDWNVVLSGYDVQTFSIRDILDNPGQLPSTGTGSADGEWANQDQTDGVGPVAHTLPASVSTTTLAGVCNPNFEAYPSFPPFPQQFKDFMSGLLTASQTVTRAHIDCNGATVVYGDWFEARTTADPTWMYITADVVYSCNKMFPAANANYWVAGSTNTGTTPYDIASGPQAEYDNVLIGDIFYINDAENFSEALNAVSLEADPTVTQDPTFYEQYSGGTDYREPLPTGWAFRYLNQGTAMSTQIRVFKRASYAAAGYVGVHDLMSDAGIGSAPSFLFADDTIPYSMYIWDEGEEALLWTGSTPPWSPSPKFCRINLFPLETQQVDISQFAVPFNSGWALLVYPPSTTNNGGTNGGSADNYQVYVSTRHSAMGRYSAALQGAVIYNANCNIDDILPAQ